MATITGVAGTSINAQCTVSNDGQPINQTESSATAQSICNDVKTIAKRLGCGYTTSVGGSWVVDLAAGGQKLFPGLTTVEKDKSAFRPVDLPHGAVVKKIRLYIAPATHANLPGTPPTFTFWEVPVDGSASSSVGGGVDATSPVAAYNAIHEVVFTLSPTVTIDRNANSYYMLVSGESGSDKDDIDILAPRVEIDA